METVPSPQANIFLSDFVQNATASARVVERGLFQIILQSGRHDHFLVEGKQRLKSAKADRDCKIHESLHCACFRYQSAGLKSGHALKDFFGNVYQVRPF